jgi:tetratricopeptide (TPR) repeat protein
MITLLFACNTLHKKQIQKGLAEYNLGVEAGKNGEYEKSVNHFLAVEKIILKHPKLEDSIISKKYLFYAMSLSLLDLLEFDEFYKKINQALEIDPNFGIALSLKAIGKCYERKPDEGVELAMQSLNIAPEHSQVYVDAGYVFIEAEKFEMANNVLDKAIKLGCSDADVFNNRGFTYLQLGLLEKAEIDINVALNLNNKNPYIYKNLALLYLKKNMIDSACFMFNKSLDHAPPIRLKIDIDSISQKNCNQ